MNVDWWLKFFIYGSVVPTTLFVILYGFGSPWARSWTGKWLLMQGIGLSAVLWLVVTATWLGDWPGRTWVRLAIYGCLFLSFCFGDAVLIYQQARARRHR